MNAVQTKVLLATLATLAAMGGFAATWYVDAVNGLVHTDLRLTAALTQKVYRLVFNYYNDEGTGLGTFYRFYLREIFGERYKRLMHGILGILRIVQNAVCGVKHEPSVGLVQRRKLPFILLALDHLQVNDHSSSPFP